MLKDFVSSTAESTTETQTYWEKKEKKTCMLCLLVDSRPLTLKRRNADKVGPGDRLYVYQQVFRGPGMSFDLENVVATTVRKDKSDDEAVYVVVAAQPVEFIKDFKVRCFC